MQKLLEQALEFALRNWVPITVILLLIFFIAVCFGAWALYKFIFPDRNEMLEI
jgi:hypothetical protein